MSDYAGMESITYITKENHKKKSGSPNSLKLPIRPDVSPHDAPPPCLNQLSK